MRRKRDLSENVDIHPLCGLPSVGDGLAHLLDGRSYMVPAFRKMEWLNKEAH